MEKNIQFSWALLWSPALLREELEDKFDVGADKEGRASVWK